MTEQIHLSKAHITDIEEEYVLRALRSGWVAPLGPDVDAFEEEVSSRVGVQYGLALSSGTAALHLALLHLGAGPGTVVVLPSMTFAASANAVAYTGAEPVFVDSQDSDGNVDPDLFIETIDILRRENKNVIAGMTVDLFGRSCDYEVIEPALAERGVALLEDAAEALGSTYQGRQAGSFGNVAALSFNGNKIMTTSSGGMLLSNDQTLIEHARKLSTQAREPEPWYEHAEIGFNYRMSNILAALGRGQLTRLDEIVARRQEVRARYAAALGEGPFRLLGEDGERPGGRDNSWLTTLVFESQDFDVHGLMTSLHSFGIEARHLWKPMHLQPIYSSCRFFGGRVSRDLFHRGIALPSGYDLTDAQVEYVASLVKNSM